MSPEVTHLAVFSIYYSYIATRFAIQYPDTHGH